MISVSWCCISFFCATSSFTKASKFSTVKIFPNNSLQRKSVNKAIQLVKMGKVNNANKVIKPSIDFLIN